MQIHTVARNDSLWNLARTYGVPLEHIVEVNNIGESDALVVGQALIIPTPSSSKTHKVARGESLWAIARQYGLSLQEIAAANNISNPALIKPGQIIIIPAPQLMTIEVNGYIERYDDVAQKEVRERANELTYLSIFSYHIKEDGTLVSIDDEALRETAIANGVTPMMVISNISEQGFSGELISHVLNTQQSYTHLITTVANTMAERGFKALNIDFEYIPPEDRELYNQFLRDITRHLHQFNYLVSSAVAPKTSSDQVGRLYEAHDYKVHGEVLDFVIIMTYEWGWTGGPPRAVAPLNEVSKVINYALTEIPANKIMLGIPLYGYEWTLPYESGVSRARALSTEAATSLAREKKAAIEYDSTAQSPHFSFYDENKKEHVVWFEDARSLQAKFNLVKQHDLRGVSYWKLGIIADTNWYLLSENFNVAKLELE
ncbi:MAG: glycosyl hydrolase family 18 protein [Candidatus Pristimantibacillus lignocellulolyticus]|uniref:Glycosyl hydrolase family 18 protein n=1 Tax=Candidatus Pristimantibacillus lignocellulolyticus TaxID=2994561 RepID=A0A9J6ZGW5_9BACL|nr:MAG: glycosyl hydrolase family 18 protein [Candidatus Pristimantibacillus lignocellulolyticus]